MTSSPNAPESEQESGLHRHVRECIADIRAGKMIILVDDEDRENEGDLVFAAEKVTPELVNFMAKHGRGLICVTLTEQQVEQLELPMMALPKWRGGPPLGTAFTLSIEARSGVTTGISAADRAHTIAVAVAEDSGPMDIVCPGHVFPLKAREGGVLVRTGQTEGSVDLARLAGLNPSGVICEIMNDDGTMARMPDLEIFAKEHSMKILSVADLITYRLQTESLIARVAETDFTMHGTGGAWRAIGYDVIGKNEEVLALVFGEPAAEATLCRVHRGNTFTDLFANPGGSTNALELSVKRIEEAGSGVIVFLPGTADIRTQLESFQRSATPNNPAASPSEGDTTREFGLGAQVIRDLGLRSIRLLTNHPRKLVGLKGFGLEVLDTLGLEA